MKKLDLKTIQKLLNYKKIIVTGPPRAGTTITTLILSEELKYKFVDETLYNGSDQNKFLTLISHPRKMVIQNTSFTKDIHKIYFPQPTAIILVKRKIEEILDSMKHTEKYLKEGAPITVDGKMFVGFNDEAKNMILKHFGSNDGENLPFVIYSHFYNNLNPNIDYFEINYDDLKQHKLYIKKEERRKKFIHIKQVNFDPAYIDKRGVIVL